MSDRPDSVLIQGNLTLVGFVVAKNNDIFDYDSEFHSYLASRNIQLTSVLARDDKLERIVFAGKLLSNNSSNNNNNNNNDNNSNPNHSTCQEKRVAIKVAKTNTFFSQQIENEQKILSKYLNECDAVPRVLQYIKLQEHHSVAMVEEPLGVGSLYNYILSYFIPNTIELEEFLLQQCARQLIQTLRSIHQSRIIHGDISPDNIIIAPNFQLVIIDFGVAMVNTRRKQRSGSEGTLPYASTNRLNQGYITTDDDFISLCFTLYALYIGIEQWEAIPIEARPTITQLEHQSKIVCTLHVLWKKS